MYKFELYQPKRNLPRGLDPSFNSLSYNETHGIPVNIDYYDLIYSGSRGDKKDNVYSVLEDIYAEFNINKPADFEGHSMSIGDVACLDDKYYYTDRCGFADISDRFLGDGIPQSHSRNRNKNNKDVFEQLEGFDVETKRFIALEIAVLDMGNVYEFYTKNILEAIDNLTEEQLDNFIADTEPHIFNKTLEKLNERLNTRPLTAYQKKILDKAENKKKSKNKGKEPGQDL